MNAVINGRVTGIREDDSEISVTLRYGRGCQELVCPKDTVHSDALSSLSTIRVGDFVTFSCHPSDVLPTILSIVQIDHQTNQGWVPDAQVEVMIAYAGILAQIREWMWAHDFIELRLPSIHAGNARPPSFPIDFFGSSARLSGSSPLQLTMLASKMGKVYSLERSFRMEPAKTKRHLAEFDILEVAVLGNDLEKTMHFLEELIAGVAQGLRKDNKDGLPSNCPPVEAPFRRMLYDEAAGNYHLEGKELGEYEQEIAREGPTFVINFPRTLAYWSARPVDETHSRSFNLLLPGVGEIAEGSEKQTDVKLLKSKFEKLGLAQQLGWYSDGLAYADSKISAFGLGVDRLAMWLLGLDDIRALHPFYRDQEFSETYEQ